MGSNRHNAGHLRWLDERPCCWLTTGSWGVLAEETAGWSAPDWDRLRWACQVHGLAPRLANLLGPLSDAPDELLAFRDWLARCQSLNSARTDRLRARLRELLLACRDDQVTVMVLKGGALRDRFDQDPMLRPTGDLDLLVEAHEQQRLGEVLVRLGYRLDEVKPRHHVYFHQTDQPQPSPLGEHPEHPIAVEAHDRVWLRRLTLLEVDLTARFWDHATAGRVEGVSMPVPAADALLEHLLLHFAGDLVAARARAVQALDLAPVAASLTSAEWHRLRDSLTAQHALPWAWLSITMARRLAPLPLPAEVEEALARATPAAFRATAQRVSWGELSACRRYRSVEHAAWRWATGPRQRSRVAYAFLQRALHGRLARLTRRAA